MIYRQVQTFGYYVNGLDYLFWKQEAVGSSPTYPTKMQDRTQMKTVWDETIWGVAFADLIKAAKVRAEFEFKQFAAFGLDGRNQGFMADVDQLLKIASFLEQEKPHYAHGVFVKMDTAVRDLVPESAIRAMEYGTQIYKV